ncbi:hypothetical protein [Halalkalirubrum salinum]|uniref:hypothetical protein n=1 Tax=Halalkalirubrum salinum TaxID=2563889 RepID=UPI0010FB3CC5|nr:hypothetical protein [Halalkalirubrum salinum]
MTQLTIEEILENLNGERIPVVRFHERGMPSPFELSAEFVQERIDGLSSFDCLIVNKEDLKTLGELTDTHLPLTVYSRPCRGHRIWLTRLNDSEDEYVFETEIARPSQQPDELWVLDVSAYDEFEAQKHSSELLGWG